MGIGDLTNEWAEGLSENAGSSGVVATVSAELAVADNRLPRNERLRGEIRVARVFSEGTGFFVYPFRCVYKVEQAAEGAETGIAFLISVPKRNHKRANKRNLLKRRTREAFRTQKQTLKATALGKGLRVSIALVYSIKDILEYKTIEDAVGKIIGRLATEI